MLQNKNILLDITKRKDNNRDPFHYFLVYKVQYEKNQEAWHECPDYYTEDDGMANKDASIDASCITYGYHIGGTRKAGGKSWEMFRSPFLKFFKKNLLK